MRHCAARKSISQEQDFWAAFFFFSAVAFLGLVPFSRKKLMATAQIKEHYYED